jgi:hypothetical protein
MSTFNRITKREARARYEANETFVMCPHKMPPGGAWASHSTIFPAEYKPEGYPDLWYSFDSMYNSWAYYNASWETGYFPHFYVEVD